MNLGVCEVVSLHKPFVCWEKAVRYSSLLIHTRWPEPCASWYVQAAEGTSFGIAPYINPRYMGSVTGIVGAGGNVGAVAFGLCFRQLDYAWAFDIMGTVILISTAMTVFYKIPGHAGLFTGVDRIVDKETGEIVEDEREEMVPISSMDKPATVL
jgi:hypothetical protein